MSKLHQIEMFLFAAGLVVLGGAGLGCSAGADDGGSNAASIDAERVGAGCVVEATPANPTWPAVPTWCGGEDWKCEQAGTSKTSGQCIPTAFCFSDSDCGCRAGEACSVVCVGRCYRACDKDRSVCEGGSRCAEEMVGSGKTVWACF